LLLTLWTSLPHLGPLLLACLLFPSRRTSRPRPPFPPRRSSDLSSRTGNRPGPCVRPGFLVPSGGGSRGRRCRPRDPPPEGTRNRSEEHTSELQSRFDLVCRLLLDKKKCKVKQHRYTSRMLVVLY